MVVRRVGTLAAGTTDAALSDMANQGLVGALVGRFRLVAMIGRGGAGEVYRAEHETISTRVAIKVLHSHASTNPDHVERLFREATAANRIRHGGIAKVFDAGWLPCGRAYLMMEHLEGETLARRLARVGRLPLARLADIARQVASVLAATHAAGIVHRDLKPDNLMLSPDCELASGERVRLLDFGIAKLIGAASAITAGVMGTPDYLAPEQWQDSRAVDGRADAYSLGCVTFEMATGHVPFPAKSVAGSCKHHLATPAPSLRELAPDLPDDLEALVANLLRKNPGERPASMREVEAGFARIAAVPSPSRPMRSHTPRIARTTVLTDTAIPIDPRDIRDEPRPATRWPLVAGMVAGAALLATGLFIRFGVATAAPLAAADPPAVAVAAVASPAPPVVAVASFAPAPTATRVAARRIVRPAPRVMKRPPPRQPIDPYVDPSPGPQPIDPY